MRPSPRALVTYGVIAAIVFLAGLAGGFVYAHEPQPDLLTVAFDRRQDDARERIVGGTVAEVRDGVLVLTGEEGQFEVAIPPGTPVEALVRAAGDAPLAPGARVNLGVEQTQSGLVLTGVVSIEEGSP